MASWKFAWVTWRRTLFLLLILLSGIGIAWLLVLSAQMLLAVFLGLILAVAIRPVTELLTKAGLSRALATGAVFLVLGAALVFAVVLAMPLVEAQAESFWASAPAACRRTATWLPTSLLGESRIHEVATACTALVRRKNAPSQVAVSYLATLPHVAWTLTIILGVAFVWTRDRENLLRSFTMFANESRRDAWRTFCELVEARLGAFLRAQLALSGLVAVVVGAFCWSLGIPNVLLVMALAAVGEAFPVVGPLVVGGLMLASVVGPQPHLVVAVIVFCVVLRGFVDYLFMPLLVRRTADVNPLLLLLCILGLGAASGFLGVAAAAPAAAIIQLVLSLSMETTRSTKEGGDRGHWAVLGYQAHVTALSARRLGRDRIAKGQEASLEDALESLAMDLRKDVAARAEGIRS